VLACVPLPLSCFSGGLFFRDRALLDRGHCAVAPLQESLGGNLPLPLSLSIGQWRFVKFWLALFFFFFFPRSLLQGNGRHIARDLV